MGLATGAVVAGNLGTDQRLEYTVIGDAVNEASRLTDPRQTHAGMDPRRRHRHQSCQRTRTRIMDTTRRTLPQRTNPADTNLGKQHPL
ncbi:MULTISPECIES: adenylate/guanylate cyclase domain-containing protein [Rhodococcus]|uniref:adenylate/guanylate cyclase domain-containing protein n=1 Tax=Rhodococcus TaxID=1827 RepID=UPI001E6206E3|nr:MULTISPECIES: adenylate/guanylate cyclase domain-containing protein [Rhodococcus]